MRKLSISCYIIQTLILNTIIKSILIFMNRIPDDFSQIQERENISDLQANQQFTDIKQTEIKCNRKKISLTFNNLLFLILLIIGIFVFLEVNIRQKQQGYNNLLIENYNLKVKLVAATQQMRLMSEELQRQKAKKQTRNQPLISTDKSGKHGTIQTNASKLPLKLPAVNKNNQKIQEVLYPDEAVRAQRIKLHRERVNYVNQKRESFQNLHLIKHNMILDQADVKLAQTDFDIDWQRIQDKFQLSKITKELPMCVVVPGYNNNAKFRIQYNLNSIFTQNYTNYKAVIINDASTDGSGDIYRKYFQFYDIDQDHYIYIQNTKRVTALQNIYLATVNHCSYDSIVLNLDADDEFIGRNVLKVINWGYLTTKSGVVYSNNIWYQQGGYIRYGWSDNYNYIQRYFGLYRSTKIRYDHLRTYRTELFHKIKLQDLKEKNGGFYTMTYDTAIYMPLMEMSCDRVYKINGQFHLLYNGVTGLNDYAVNGTKQHQVHIEILSKPRYECNKEFNDRMKIQI